MMDIVETPFGAYFFMAKATCVGKETIHASIADNVLYKLDQQDTRKVTGKL